MTELSPAAQTVWDAFNKEEAGVFVDYGDKLAAAFRAAADQVVPHIAISEKDLVKQLAKVYDQLLVGQVEMDKSVRSAIYSDLWGLYDLAP